MATESTTRALQARDKIRQDILAGRWAPGEKVIREELAKAYGISSTLVREALISLVGEHLLEASPNHGFRVPEINLDHLAGLTETRCRIDALGVEIAFERGDLDWESDVVVAHHRLARTAYDPEAPQPWVEAHRAFHASIIEACDVEVLKSFSRILFNCTELYRRSSAKKDVMQTWMPRIEREHEELLDAVVARDTARAVDLLVAHHRGTIALMNNEDPQPKHA